MATAAQEGGSEVSIGRVFSRAFAALGAHPFATFGLAFVVAALPSMILYTAVGQLNAGLGTGWSAVVLIALGPLNMALTAAAQGMVTFTVVEHDQGQRADIVDTLPPALIRLVPSMLLGFLVGIGFMFGLILLIIPGIILYAMWWVAVPAMVVERLGVVPAMKRSASLTDGARWKVVGVEFVLGMSAYAFNMALRAGGLLWDPVDHATGGSGLLNQPLLPILLYLVVQAVAQGVYAAMHASFYVELRTWKEGPAIGALAEVFS